MILVLSPIWLLMNGWRKNICLLPTGYCPNIQALDQKSLLFLPLYKDKKDKRYRIIIVAYPSLFNLRRCAHGKLEQL
jgi:hypothetical protein